MSHLKKQDKKRLQNIGLRYAILVLLAFFAINVFYIIFQPLTIYPVKILLDIFYDVSLVSSTIILIESVLPINLIPACIAGSAYFLLLILNLSTPEIETKKRIYMIVMSFLAFLIINILRIVILSMMAYSGSAFFDITHQIFWYGLSTLFVVGIWFTQIKCFRILTLPFFSDLKYLYKML